MVDDVDVDVDVVLVEDVDVDVEDVLVEDVEVEVVLVDDVEVEVVEVEVVLVDDVEVEVVLVDDVEVDVEVEVEHPQSISPPRHEHGQQLPKPGFKQVPQPVLAQVYSHVPPTQSKPLAHSESQSQESPSELSQKVSHTASHPQSLSPSQ